MILDKLKHAIFIILISATTSTHAGGMLEWTANDIQLAHGSGFKLGANYRSTLRILHANGWRYGDNFMFIEFVQRDDIGMEVYGEWYPRLSLGRLSNKDLSFGVFRDFFLVGGINASTEPEGDAFKAYLLGMGTAFKLPNSGFLNLNVLARKQDKISTTGIQITPSWSIPFEIGRLKFKFDGFIDLVSADSSGGKSYILAQPQLLFDVGHLVGHSGSVYMGIEYHYWRNKFGIDGVHDKALQGMLKVIF
jgi:nucleoside-specific outer membrane channel protein Tsx